MALIKSIRGIQPQIGEESWLAPNAVIAGEVYLGRSCSVWYHAVLRGDVGAITLGSECNVQDGAIVHCTTGKSTVSIGHRVTIGHRALVHGCHLEDEVLIGMGAIVLDNATVGSGAIIAAGAVVLENTRVPEHTLWAGVPARQVKELPPQAQASIAQIAQAYTTYKDWH